MSFSETNYATMTVDSNRGGWDHGLGSWRYFGKFSRQSHTNVDVFCTVSVLFFISFSTMLPTSANNVNWINNSVRFARLRTNPIALFLFDEKKKKNDKMLWYIFLEKNKKKQTHERRNTKRVFSFYVETFEDRSLCNI